MSKPQVTITFEKGHSWKKSSAAFKKAMIKLIKLAAKMEIKE